MPARGEPCHRQDIVKPMLCAFWMDTAMKETFLHGGVRPTERRVLDGVQFDSMDAFLEWLPKTTPGHAYYNYLELLIWVWYQREGF